MSFDAMVSVRGVAKVFHDAKRGRETVALQEIDLDIGESEFLCLLGPSGCGKSTILNLIAGFEQPTRGSVAVAGQAVQRPGPDRSVVFQQPQLFPWLSVLDNVTFGLRMAGEPAARCVERAHRYIQLVGLTGFDGHYPYELSGGMQQRVSIARAWISQPRTLLMDEPFGALDAQTRQMMQELLLSAWEKQRTTVLFVTHDIDEALFLADRLAVMTARPGRIKEVVSVDFPRPRQYDTLIFQPEYIRLKQRVLASIRSETLKVMQSEAPHGALQ
jgi:NitT/TauT family transport system ATP-binding protein